MSTMVTERDATLPHQLHLFYLRGTVQCSCNCRRLPPPTGGETPAYEAIGSGANLDLVHLHYNNAANHNTEAAPFTADLHLKGRTR